MDSSPALADLPLDQLHDSPFQPRKTYTGLEGLAESIRTDGIQQPLKVRPLTTPEGAPASYEVIFGHRRMRAAELAGLTVVPCMVVVASDAEVRSAQMAENVQRDNMRALEEAAGFQAQIDQDGISQAELARRIGKSTAFVNGRLRLLSLVDQVREAVNEGRIGAEVALLIARVGPASVQIKALQAIDSHHLGGDLEDGGRGSFRSIRNLLNERFTLRLKEAMFDPEDPALTPDSGVCSACPKRTGNSSLYQDIAQPDERKNKHGMSLDYLPKGGPEICTDPSCFDAKKTAHLKRQADQLIAEGKTVVDGNKARQAIDSSGNIKGAYVAVSAVKGELQRVRKGIIAKGELPPAVVTIQDPRNGKIVQAYRRADVEAAGVNLAAKAQPKQRGVDYEAEREIARAKCIAETAARRRLLLKVREAAKARPRDHGDLLMVVRHALNEADLDQQGLLAELWECSSAAVLGDGIDDMSFADLAQLLLDISLTADLIPSSYWDESDPEALLEAAERYGIDIEAARAESPPSEPADAVSTPSPAARAAKKGAVKYLDPMTGATWTGRGLRPAWLVAALGEGKALTDFEVSAEQTDKARSAGKSKKDKASSAGRKVKDNTGSAGDAARDESTADMFEGAQP